MKNKKLIIIAALTVTILAVAGTVAGAMYRDKDIVLSKNVSKDIQAEESEINSIIDEGKGLLEKKKYNDAKISFEKAISKEITRIETYTTIIDIYKEKTRYDDAYYFLKLSKTNNLEIKDYAKLEEGIKSNFEVVEIPVVSCVGDKYELPKEITVKINNEATNVQVEWENTTLDLSKEGNIKVKGLIKNYEREAVLNIEIKGLMTKEEGKAILDSRTLHPEIKCKYVFNREIRVNNRVMYEYRVESVEYLVKYEEPRIFKELVTRGVVDIRTREVYREHSNGYIENENGDIIGVADVTPADLVMKEYLQERKGYSAIEAIRNSRWRITDSYISQINLEKVYNTENWQMTAFYNVDTPTYDITVKEISINEVNSLVGTDHNGTRAVLITAQRYGSTEYLFILNEDNTKAKVYEKETMDDKFKFLGNAEYSM